MRNRGCVELGQRRRNLRESERADGHIWRRILLHFGRRTEDEPELAFLARQERDHLTAEISKFDWGDDYRMLLTLHNFEVLATPLVPVHGQP